MATNYLCTISILFFHLVLDHTMVTILNKYLFSYDPVLNFYALWWHLKRYLCSPVISEIFAAQYLFFCVMLCQALFVFLFVSIILSTLLIILSTLLTTSSHYPFGIFKLVLYRIVLF
jgi:hypothetical protein